MGVAIRLGIALLVSASAWASPSAAPATTPYAAALHLSGKIGSRPEGGRNERRAHDYVADQFRSAGLEVTVSPFSVPGRNGSRNVIGKLDTPASCLTILMAHTDSVPPGHGAIDNASGVGVLVALAPEVAALKPSCDVWLVATGSEERQVTGLSYHAGAAALVKTVKDDGRGNDLQFALSMDEVGLGRRFYLRSPQPVIRQRVEGAILGAAHRAGSRSAGRAIPTRGTPITASSSSPACRAPCWRYGRASSPATTWPATGRDCCRNPPSIGRCKSRKNYWPVVDGFAIRSRLRGGRPA
jgi:hypothetical protein